MPRLATCFPSVPTRRRVFPPFNPTQWIARPIAAGARPRYASDLTTVDNLKQHNDNLDRIHRASEQYQKRAKSRVVLAGTLLVAAWGCVATEVILHREEVPVTKRIRYSGTPGERALQDAFWKKLEPVVAAAEAKSISRVEDDAWLLRRFWDGIWNWFTRKLAAARIKGVLDRIAATAGLEHTDWKVKVVQRQDQDPLASMNGFAQFSMNQGYLRAMESDAELAFVVGHEVAHYLVDHSREKLRIVGVSALCLLPIVPFAVLIRRLRPRPRHAIKGLLFVPMVATYLAWKYMSRVMEYEADLIGLQLMSNAGYDTEGAIAAMQGLEDYMNRNVPPSAQWMLDLPVNSHPHIRRRFQRTREQISQIRGHINQCIDTERAAHGASLSADNVELWRDFKYDQKTKHSIV